MEWERVVLKLTRAVGGFALRSLRNREAGAELAPWESALCEELGLADEPEEEAPLTVITLSPEDLTAPAQAEETKNSTKTGTASKTTGRAKAGQSASTRKSTPKKRQKSKTTGATKKKPAGTGTTKQRKTASTRKTTAARGKTSRTVTRKAS